MTPDEEKASHPLRYTIRAAQSKPIFDREQLRAYTVKNRAEEALVGADAAHRLGLLSAHRLGLLQAEDRIESRE